MTDRPYTDDDLIAEAARQHYTATTNPDFMGIGEQMEGTEIPSLTSEDEPGVVEGTTWDELSRDDFDAAQHAIDDLLSKAADVSAWAVKLGADGLQPEDHTIQLGAKGPAEGDEDEPFVRLHFAFAPDVAPEERDRFVMRLGQVVLRNL